MASVTFSASVGGDGRTVTDDSNPATGLDGGGHRTRFVPCLAQTVAVAAYTVGRASAAASSASSAATSAANAATSASAAATSATNAANSASAAAASASSAASVISAAFPVGAVYITAGNTNPGTFLGGTWAQIAQGRALIGVGSLGSDTYAAGETGGAALVTLSKTEMPWHNHGGVTGGQSNDHTHGGWTDSQGTHQHSYIDRYKVAGTGAGDWGSPNEGGMTESWRVTEMSGAHSHNVGTNGVSANHTHAVFGEGGGGAHENRMPYLAVYFWQRTA